MFPLYPEYEPAQHGVTLDGSLRTLFPYLELSKDQIGMLSLFQIVAALNQIIGSPFYKSVMGYLIVRFAECSKWIPRDHLVYFLIRDGGLTIGDPATEDTPAKPAKLIPFLHPLTAKIGWCTLATEELKPHHLCCFNFSQRALGQVLTDTAGASRAILRLDHHTSNPDSSWSLGPRNASTCLATRYLSKNRWEFAHCSDTEQWRPAHEKNHEEFELDHSEYLTRLTTDAYAGRLLVPEVCEEEEVSAIFELRLNLKLFEGPYRDLLDMASVIFEADVAELASPHFADRLVLFDNEEYKEILARGFGKSSFDKYCSQFFDHTRNILTTPEDIRVIMDEEELAHLDMERAWDAVSQDVGSTYNLHERFRKRQEKLEKRGGGVLRKRTHPEAFQTTSMINTTGAPTEENKAVEGSASSLEYNSVTHDSILSHTS